MNAVAGLQVGKTWIPKGEHDYVVVETSSSPFAMLHTVALWSNVITLAISYKGVPLKAPAGIAMELSFILKKTANAPACMRWAPSKTGGNWVKLAGALISKNRGSGSTVKCSISQLGSYAIVETCTDKTTCSGHGKCNFDGATFLIGKSRADRIYLLL